MNSEERALLSGIRDCPEDDIARLVYADWLEEHDQGHRAARIRRYVASKVTFGFPLRKLGPPHLHGIADWWDKNWGVQIDRGFVSGIQLPTADWLKHAAEIWSAHPLQTVTLTDRRPLPQRFGSIDVYLWLVAHDAGDDEYPHCLPDVLFAHLPVPELKGGLEPIPNTFTSEKAAHKYLSRACLAHGRSEAHKLAPDLT